MIRLAALFAVVAQPALALSCLPYGVQDTWLDATAASERYIVVAGAFELTATTSPRPAPKPGESLIGMPQAQTYSASFTGQALSGATFSHSVSGKATVSVNCVAQWCGNLPAAPWIAFLREDGQGGYETEIGPCASKVYADTPSTRGAVTSCASGGACRPVADMIQR